MINKALYVTEDVQFVIRDDLHHKSVTPNELLIETRYSGANPADIKHATLLGIRPTVIGYDFAGRVLKAPLASDFKEGDAVAGYTPSSLGRPTKYGSHQSSLAVPCDMVFKIPSNLPEVHAAALTSSVMTAADVVHNLFKFPLPSNPGDSSDPVLIWGASSTVGLSALQLARASSCRNIFVTASPTRHDILRSLGATHAFDYSSATVVAEITAAVKALGKGPITHALDAAGTEGRPSSADLMVQSVSESTVLCSVVLRPGSTFQMPVALAKDVWRIHPPDAQEPLRIPARPADHWNAWTVLHWAITNYGTKFKLPSVSVLDVTAEEALGELFRIQNGKRGFGKVVFQHPLK
ncbi:alcohol dehydrogenase [Apiospora kogelbergensis]|uniref:Alcohol dehydrogenase n=1 Tax=Apiospora kogelbergensis TaxID=1337665 RepID=A0AAW0QKN8_9PEZI